jgi:L-2-hydroxycarboxylate dehydrogenase (NAD+)
VFIVVEPVAASVFASVSAYLDALRMSAPAESQRPVAVPGDRAQARRTKSLKEGIAIDAALWSEICSLASEPDFAEIRPSSSPTV